MGKRGNVATGALSVAFWVVIAIIFGISLLIYVENAKDKSSFYMKKDVIDLAYSLNTIPLAYGSLEIRYHYRPDFSYKIKDGRVSASKNLDSEYQKFVEDSYFSYNIEKKDSFLVIKNEQKS